MIIVKRHYHLEYVYLILLLCMQMVQNSLYGQSDPYSNQTVYSPNEKLAFQFYQKKIGEGKSQLYYSVTFDGNDVLLESELGIQIENNLFESALGIQNDLCEFWCENLALISVDTNSVNEVWIPVYGERSSVLNHYNEMVLHFQKYGNNTDKKENINTKTTYDRRRTYEMDIVVRVFNEGVAFCYSFPETKNGLFLHTTGEQTSFTFPDNTMAYYERWAQGPYEYLPLKDWPDECERPLTLKLKNGLRVALLEAQMIDYSRGKFKLDTEKDNTIDISLYGKVDVISPYVTPWRVIMVAASSIELVKNNDIILNLNKPNELLNTSWIKSGKVIRSGLSMEQAKACVDFANEHNLHYVHLDAGWYGPEMKISSDATTVSPEKDLDMYKLVDYAAEKGVGIFVYINQRALVNDLDRVFEQCRKWGIKGVKFGFVQVGSNRWTIWLHDAVKKAADYQLMVDIHDEYRPTGFSRTYPNLMTQEGIRGNEEMPDATHNSILPFTRFLAGAADYTICYYNNRIKTTHAHQLALSVVYYSPVQFLYWYDNPSLYKGEPEIEFFDAVPTVWDDTQVLGGEIGEYIITARRFGDEWFIGAITNKEARTVEIDFNFLAEGKKYTAKLYQDDENVDTRTQVSITNKPVSRQTKLKLELKESGGLAIWVKEQK